MISLVRRWPLASYVVIAFAWTCVVLLPHSLSVP